MYFATCTWRSVVTEAIFMDFSFIASRHFTKPNFSIAVLVLTSSFFGGKKNSVKIEGHSI